VIISTPSSGIQFNRRGVGETRGARSYAELVEGLAEAWLVAGSFGTIIAVTGLELADRPAWQTAVLRNLTLT
jgi:hypothetical protein